MLHRERGGNRRADRTGVDADVDRTSLWHSLRAYPDFRTLFYTTIATNGSYWMWNMATGWLALVLTDSAFFVGLTAFLNGIPMLLFTLPAGVLIDRVDRRLVLLGAQLGMTIVSCIVSFLLFFDLMRPWHLLFLSFVAGSVMSFVFPSRNALIANLVPPKDLANAVGLNATGQNAARVVGPALAGPLIALAGLSGTFFICMVVLILAMVFSIRLPRTVPTPSVVQRTLWGSMREGLTVIGRSEYLTGLFILAVVPTMFFLPYTNMLPVFARDVLAIGSSGLGLLMAANGLGGVVGSLLIASSRRLTYLPGVLIWTSLALGSAVLAFAVTPAALLAGALIFLAGLFNAAYSAINNTQIQLAVDDSVRGRVLSVYLVTWGLMPLGVLPVGVAADMFGAPGAVAGLAFLGLLLTAVTMVRFPSLRGAMAAEPVEAQPRA